MDIITVSNFKKSFKEKVIHKDVTFTLKKGECLGLVGGSGAGKSVILKSLIGLIEPDSGQISVNGKNPHSVNEQELIKLRQSVAYVFQNGALFDSMTVYENLAYPLKAHTTLNQIEIQNKITSLLETLGLVDIEDRLPSQLSGGMQKRVGLARSIILGPDIILYDEPTAGLDPLNTKKIQEIILKLKKTGVSSIFVSHDVHSALAVCDRISFLSHGKIILTDDVKNIKNNPESPIYKFLNGEDI